MNEQQTMTLNKNKPKLRRPKWQQILFYISFVGLPVIQFVIFYIVVNFQTIIYAFQKFDWDTNSYIFVGFENIKNFLTGNVWQIVSAETLATAFKNSFILYGFTLLFGTTLALLFSSYIYKKRFASGFFRVVLYLPHVVSSISVVIVYKLFVGKVLPDAWFTLSGIRPESLYANVNSKFFVVLFLAVYLTFGNNVLIYTSSMSGISPSIVESAELDGITPFKEFIHITLPSIFPTVVNFLVAGLALLFTDQMLLYSFEGASAPGNIMTVGYYLYMGALKVNPAYYPELSAVGLFLTVVVTLVTILVRYLLNKFGPSVE